MCTERQENELNAALALPPNTMVIREYSDADREAVTRLGGAVIDWWHSKGPGVSLNLVAAHRETGEIAGHLQAMDAGVPEPSRRAGQCQFTLRVAPEHRRHGVGGALYRHAESFARRRSSRLIYAAYIAHDGAPAASFLRKRGFEPLETFYPSYLDLASFDPAPFASAIGRLEEQGIRLTTLATVGDTPDHRQRLYQLEQSARATQPFREVAPYVPEPFAQWEKELEKRDPTATFLAIVVGPGRWVGVVTGLEWYFTGVNPDWRGRGIATALKLRCIVEAKRRGIARMETENHGDNLAMIAVNRKLGFIFTDPEVACIKRL